MSEIFNEYAKIAVAQGLVDLEPEGKGTEKKPPRYDSRTIEDIQMLYGVKPKEDYDSIGDLVDKAHPETYVACRSYDPMNAVVENVFQRQSIMADVALRTPDGLLIQKRYVQAYQDLMNALVSTGFEMDTKNEPELMKIADSCAGELEKKAWLGAALRLLIPAAKYIIPAIIGSFLINKHLDVAVQNVKANAEKVKSEAADLVEENPWLQKLIAEMEILQRKADEYERNNLTIQTLIKSARTPQVETQLEELSNKLEEYEQILVKEKQNLLAWSKGLEGINERGELPDWMYKALQVSRALITTSNVDQLKQAIGSVSTVTGAVTGVFSGKEGGTSSGLIGAIDEAIKRINQTQQEAKILAQQEQTQPEIKPLEPEASKTEPALQPVV